MDLDIKKVHLWSIFVKKGLQNCQFGKFRNKNARYIEFLQQA